MFKFSHSNPDFYIQIKGENSGKPLKSKIPNSVGIVVDRDKLVPDYLFYIVQHLFLTEEFRPHITGSAVPFITLPKIKQTILNFLINNNPNLFQMKKIQLPQSLIEETISKASDEVTAFINLYRIAIPDFDKVKSINGFPKVSTKTAVYLIDKLSEKSEKPVDMGLLWMNQGFSADENTPHWTIDVSNVQLSY
jgi:hypothetical protein